jgi:hypothetical protein
MQKVLYCIRSKNFLWAHYYWYSGIKSKVLSWIRTHHIFNELKIIVMGNGYGTLRAFLLDSTK